MMAIHTAVIRNQRIHLLAHSDTARWLARWLVVGAGFTACSRESVAASWLRRYLCPPKP